jgi:CHAT domain
MRENRLNAVLARIDAYESGRDPAGLFSVDSLLEAAELLRFRTAGVVDLEALSAAGRVLFLRAQIGLLPEPARMALVSGWYAARPDIDLRPVAEHLRAGTMPTELMLATQLLWPVWRANPGAVLPVVRVYFEVEGDPGEGLSPSTGFTTDPQPWLGLGQASFTVFSRTGDLTALRAAVAVDRLACEAAGPSHPQRRDCLGMVASALALLRAETHELETISEVISVCTELLSITSGDEPNRWLFLANLGTALLDKVRYGGDDLAATHRAAAAFCEAASLAPDGDNRARSLSNQAMALAETARICGTEIPDEALLLAREAIGVGSADRLGMIQNLDTMLNQRFEGITDVAGARRLAAICDRLLAARPTDTDADVPVLATLVAVWAEESRHGDDREPLSRALAASQRLIELLPPHGSATALAWANVGVVRVTLAEQTGDERMAALAVEAAERAADAAERPAEVPVPGWADGKVGPSPADLAFGLAAARSVLYDISRDPVTLREAQADSARAKSLVDGFKDPRRQGRLLAAHAAIQRKLAGLTNDLYLAEQAVAAYRDAQTVPGNDSVGQAITLLGLCAALCDLVEIDPQVGAEHVRWASEAVQAAEEAQRLAGEMDWFRLFLLTERTRALRNHGQLTGDTAMLRLGVQVGRDAVAVNPAGTPGHDYASRELARVCAQLELRDPGDGAAEEALAVYDGLVSSPGAQMHHRLGSAVEAARLAAATGSGRRELGFYEAAVDLLRISVFPGMLRADRENVLKRYAFLPAAAAAAGIAAGQPQRALELLDRSRGLLAAERLGLWADAAMLRKVAPELAREHEDLRAQFARIDAIERRAVSLEQPGSVRATDPVGPGRLLRGAERAVQAERRRLTDRLSALSDRLAQIPGPGFAEVTPTAALAADGPVIYLVPGSPAGFALVLTDDPDTPVVPVPLPGLADDAALDRTLIFLTAVNTATRSDISLAARRESQREVVRTLGWLWDVAAEPVLAALGLAGPHQGGRWPRVWWCPSGYLRHLPWHAAGHHEDGSQRAVLDRAVSSYITSLQSLAAARMQAGPMQPDDSLLIVAQAKAPSAAALDGVKREVSAIIRLVPQAAVLREAAATKDAVLDGIMARNSVHLACHAAGDVRYPGNSKLLLADHETDPLTAHEIAGLRLNGKSLAVLSACSTYQASPTLSDEPLDLAAAFQSAGFRHVIGTMWRVSDETSAQVSQHLYSRLSRGRNGQSAPAASGLDVADCALALHLALRALRDAHRRVPTLWASYIHLGA